MKGVTPIATPLTLPMARDAQRSLDLLFRDCADDPVCHAVFPHLEDEFQNVMQRLDPGVETEVSDGKGGKVRVKISRAAIALTIRSLLQ